MTARFEVYTDANDHFRFRLVTGEGAVLLRSVAFENEDDAIAGIWSARNTVATARIVDLTGTLTATP